MKLNILKGVEFEAFLAFLAVPQQLFFQEAEEKAILDSIQLIKKYNFYDFCFFGAN